MFSRIKHLLTVTWLAPILLHAQSVIGVAPGQGPTLTTPASATPPEQKCVVEGRVTNSQTGVPVKRADVRLLRQQQANSAGRSGLEGYAGSSETDGSFHFDAVEPGSYSLSGAHSGFLNTQFGATRPLSAGTTLSLRPAQKLSNLNLALIPQSIISGKVVDEDGEPVQGVMVQALRETWLNGRSQYMPRGGGSTNDMGEFRLTNLSPGKYYISCQTMNRMGGNEAPASPDKPDIRPVRTYYPDAISRETAAPITVKTAQDMPGMDIHLRRVQTYHVRGKIAGSLPEGGADRLSLTLSLRDDFMPMFFGGGSNVGKDGTFDLAGVAPGAYTLSLAGMNGRNSGFARQPIEVGSSDLNGVVLTVVPPGTLRGVIQVEGKPESGVAAADLSNVRLFFSSVDRSFFNNVPETSVKNDGTFTVDNVNPGKYFVHVMGGPDGSYVKSIQFGRQEVFGKELDLSQGASGELNIVFRYGAVELSGTIQSPEGAASTAAASAGQPASQPSASVVLVPDAVNDDGSGMSFATADQNGAFTLKRLRPGHYHAYAFEQLDMNQWQNPAVRKQLESKGTDVELTENDKKQIQLSVISSADLQQTLASLGIESQ